MAYNSKCHLFFVMIPFIRSWLFYCCSMGAVLCFLPSVHGQRVRELIDLTPPPAQPSGSVPSPGPAAPSPPQPNSNVSSVHVISPVAPITVAPSALGELGGFLIPSSTAGSSPLPSASPEMPAVPTRSMKQQVGKIASVFEETTEDEQEECELQTRRQRAEQIADLEIRKEELARVTRSETSYQNRLARRKAEEVGADLFYVPRLKEQFLKDGWCQLFDGHTDTNWKIQTKGPYAGGQFTFDNGEICSNPRHPGLVYTSIPFGDVTVRFDFCA